MSRDMRSSARKPNKPRATTIVKSEIGRRNANDTRFIVPPQPVQPRPDNRARLDGSNKNNRDIAEKCSSYFRPNAHPPGPDARERGAELGRGAVLECRESAGPDDPTLQSNAVVS